MSGIRVRCGPVVGELGRAGGRAQSRGLEAVLDRHRDAVQRAPRLAARERGLGLGRARARAFGVERHHRVQARVVLLDAPEVDLEQLAARHLAASECRGQLGCEGCHADRIERSEVQLRRR